MQIGVSAGVAAGFGAVFGLIEGMVLELLTARDEKGNVTGRHKWYRWVQIGLLITKFALLGGGIALIVLTAGTASVALMVVNAVLGMLASWLGKKAGEWLAQKAKQRWPFLAIDPKKCDPIKIPPPPAHPPPPLPPAWKVHGHAQREGKGVKFLLV